ncbi:uncharacterized protein LOC132042936 [Lycium ferocissimum]|uniref:uncharacterized protein LOC132042936 n=1 Tax=Lycium ferocissimum TaxID=112874 RepID=UPI0028164401|nr:uncharacterized protein LOC132042936 [Lycium ferocissimum]
MAYSLLSELHPNRDDWMVRVRVCRMWEFINFKRSKDLDNLMHAVIWKNQVNRFRDKLSEGSVIIIRNFKVTDNTGVYRPVSSNFKITFLQITIVQKQQEDIVRLPVNGFQFIQPDMIQSRVNNNTILSGEITFATTCASKIYVNLKIDYINSLKEKFSNKSVGVETLQSANVETLPIEEQMFQNRMSICELLESEWSIDIQECIVTVWAKITEIDNSFDWYYISCNFCRKKIKPANGVYTCPTCTTDCKFPLMRFKIHICVADKTGGTTLVLFNAIAEKLLDTSAHKLVNRLASGDNGIPSQIENLCGKEFVFKLKLNSYNLKDGLENFTVIKLFPPDEELELQHTLAKEKKGKNIVDDVDEPENQKAEGFNKGKEHASANDFDDVVEDDLDSDGVTSTNQPSTSTKLRRKKNSGTFYSIFG